MTKTRDLKGKTYMYIFDEDDPSIGDTTAPMVTTMDDANEEEHLWFVACIQKLGKRAKQFLSKQDASHHWGKSHTEGL